MLTYINIKNFAIIKDLEVDFQSEMTGITGETGAGKSIIIDSLELALGARADASLIRNNKDRCEITVMFDIDTIELAKKWLIKHELDSENECIIRRTINNDGRSKSTINGYSCTQQALRTLSHFLLSIHGQHENQNLINSEYQRELLDAFSDNKPLLSEVKKLYDSWLKTKKELLELENLAEDHQDKIDFLNYQLNELEACDSSTTNLEDLQAKQKRIHNLEEFTKGINSALNILAENDSAIIDTIHYVKNQLETCQKIDSQIAPATELVDTAIIQIQEAISTLKQNADTLEIDKEEQQQIEEQLSTIHTLARKHHVQPEELEQVQIELQQQLEKIQNSTAELEKLQGEVAAAEKLYLKAANELTSKRKQAIIKLNKLVTEKMQLLGMIEGKFKAKLLPNNNNTFSAHGLERIEFLVAANPGQPLQPLNKVGSGGELSRISLAIQTITAEKEITPTLIFDEIDSGIGGKTADIVGQLLRKLAEKTQIICITHLPQIAAQSHHHILIEKTTKLNDINVSLTTLNKSERINEIARMLSGTKITKQTLAHAREMIDFAI